MQPTHFITSDTTRLTLFEGGNPKGPAVLFCNGLGGNMDCWRPIVNAMRPDYRLLCWDYRGLFTSGPSVSGAYDIRTHAEDLAAILDERGIEKPILVGWSMGVQVILEHLRGAPDRAAAFVALNGTPGSPFKTAFDRDLHREIQLIFSIMGKHWSKASWMKPFAHKPIAMRAFMLVAERLGLTSPRIDREVFRDLSKAWVELDLGIYSEIFRHLSEHDATDVLRRVRVPSLLIGGDADRMTPLHRTAMMAAEIPGGELFVVPGGTHFSAVEFPEVILPRLKRFLAERVHPDVTVAEAA